MSGNSSRRRSQTAPIVCSPAAGLVSGNVVIGAGTSSGTCRSGPRRRPRARLLSIRRLLTNVPLRLPRSRIVNPLPSRTSSACLRDTVTSSRNTSHSGDRPISARSPIASKLSPARPPPDRTTSAGPSMLSCAGAASMSSGSEAHGRLPHGLPREERAAARAVRRRLRALESALGAVDVTHWPPPRIEPRSSAATCPPLRVRFARSARMMSICACITRRLSEMSSSSCSSRRISAQSAASSRLARSGSGSRSASAGKLAGALVERALERRERLRLEAARGDLRPEPLRPLGSEDVDPPVEDAAAARDRILAFLDLREQRRELGVGERLQVRERFHDCLSGR